MIEIPVGESNTKPAVTMPEADVSKKSDYQTAIEIMLGLQDVDRLTVMAIDDVHTENNRIINMAKTFRYNFLNIIKEEENK